MHLLQSCTDANSGVLCTVRMQSFYLLNGTRTSLHHRIYFVGAIETELESAFCSRGVRSINPINIKCHLANMSENSLRTRFNRVITS